jgi:hypothetical protein
MISLAGVGIMNQTTPKPRMNFIPGKTPPGGGKFGNNKAITDNNQIIATI